MSVGEEADELIQSSALLLVLSNPFPGHRLHGRPSGRLNQML